MFRTIVCSLLFLFTSISSQAIIRWVENLNNSGPGSLRDVIAMTANGDTIQFEVTGTIALTTGKLDVLTGILIDGPGMDLLTITSGGSSTVFDVSSASAHIRGMTIEDADPRGVYVHGTTTSFTLENVRIQDCYNESSSASGIYVSGASACSIINCELLNNSVYGDGITYVSGGGAYLTSAGQIIVSGCLFQDNTASSINWGGVGSKADSKGGGLYVSAPDVQILNSNFIDNHCGASGCCGYSPNWAYAWGGGLYCGGAKVTLDGVYAYSNSLSTNDYQNYELKQGMACFIANADSAFVSNSTFRSNSAGFNGQYVNVYGGALYAKVATYIEIDNVQASQNSGQSVGAVTLEASNYLQGTAIVNRLVADSNTVSASTPERAAIFLSRFESTTITNSSFTGNSNRAVTFDEVLEAELSSSFFDDNQGHAYFGAQSDDNHLIRNNTFSGSTDFALNCYYTTGIDLENNTFIDNWGDVYLNNSSVNVKNNILSYTSYLAASYGATGSTSVTSGGGNVVKGANWVPYLSGPMDIHNSDPQLIPAADNGGPTWTYALPSNSSAINREPGGALGVDQRGFLRDGNVDAGAFEFGAADPTSIVFSGITPNVAACDGSAVVLEATFISGLDLSYQWYKADAAIDGQILNTLIIDPVAMADAGDYKCEATNEGGTLESSVVTVSVNALPTVSIDAADGVCPGAQATLTASGASSYEWDNGLGAGDQIEVGPSEETSYTVVGTDDNSCENSAMVTLVVFDYPDVTITGENAVCEGQTATYTAGGADSYVWEGGLGTDPEIDLLIEEFIELKVTGTDANSCSNFYVLAVNALALPTVETGLDVEICAGETVDIWADGGETYTWDMGLGDGAIQFVSPSETTTYNVTVTAANGCESAGSVTVGVLQLPDFTLSEDATICYGDSVLLEATGDYFYLWADFGGDPANWASPESDYTYYVYALGDNNCGKTDSIFVSVLALPAIDAGNDEAICIGQSITLSASGGSTYSWDNGLGEGESFEVSPEENTTYTVIGFGDNGCEGSDEKEVVVNSLPNIDAGADVQVCEGEPITLSASGGLSYEWDGGIDNDNPFTPAESAVYTVIGEDENGCTATDEVSVDVLPLPEPLIFQNGLELSTTLYASFQWYWNGLPIADGDEQLYTANANGAYTVVVTDTNGCTGESEPLIITSIGIEENTSDGLVIYPNPITSGDQLFINLPQLNSSFLLQLLDLRGKLVEERVVSENTEITSLSTHGLSTGVYVLRVMNHPLGNSLHKVVIE